MKKFSVFLCSLAFVLGVVGTVSASPVNFLVDADDSAVSLSSNSISWRLGSATILGELVADLENQHFTVNDNATHELDFFTLTVGSTGLGAVDKYYIEATLAFNYPDAASTTGSGSGVYGSALGVIQGGTLYWDDSRLPNVVTLADGNVINIDFEEGIAIGLGKTVTVHAYISNKGGGLPVPEPATMLLFGFGLVGLAGLGRRKFFKK